MVLHTWAVAIAASLIIISACADAGLGSHHHDGACNVDNDLALMQTAVLVDDAHLVVPSSNSAAAEPMPKGIDLAARILVIAAFVSVMFVFMRVRRVFSSSSSASLIPANSQDSVVLESGTRDATDANAEEEEMEEVPNYMSWGTYLLGLNAIGVSMFTGTFFTPNLPQMALDFGCTQQHMLASIQINWIVSGVAQLVVGPLSDRIGRKPCMIYCLVCSGACYMAQAGNNNIYWFWAARAIGACSGGELALVRAQYRDCYDMKKRVRIAIMTGVVLIFMPICAPALGGYMARGLGSWRYPFAISSIASFVTALLCFFFFDETLHVKQEFVKLDYMTELRNLCKDRHIMTLLAVGVFMECMGKTSSGNDVFIVEETFGMSSIWYAKMQGSFVIIGLVSAVAFMGIQEHVQAIRVAQVLFAIAPILTIYQVWTGVYLLKHLNVWIYYLWNWVSAFFLVWPTLCLGPLYMEKMRKSAGMATAIESASKSFIGSALAWGTQSVVAHSEHSPAMLMFCEAGWFVLVIFTFWVGIGIDPPEWAFVEKKKAEKEARNVGAEAMAEGKMQKEYGETMQKADHTENFWASKGKL